MKLSEMKDKMYEDLNKRIQESYDSRQSTGKFKGIFKEDLQIPIWKIKDGEHLIDILPYLVGEGNPNPRVKSGDIGHVLTLFVHNGIGVNENQYVCLSRNYNKPCPVCEYQNSLKNAGEDPDSLKYLNPTRRCVYNVLVYDDQKEEEKGVQIMMVAHYFMERTLSELAKAPRGGGWIYFPAPDKRGKSISFKREGTGARNTQYLAHKFVDRDYDIPNEVLDNTYCLEDIVNVPSYEEVYEALHGKASQVAEKSNGTPLVAESHVAPAAGIGRVRGGKVSTVDESSKQDAKPAQTNDPACPDDQGQIGTSIDKLRTCQTCVVYEQCFALNEEIEKLEREKRRASITSRRGNKA